MWLVVFGLMFVWLVVMALFADSEITRAINDARAKGEFYPRALYNMWYDEFKDMRYIFRVLFTLAMMVIIYILTTIVMVLSGMMFHAIIFKKEKEEKDEKIN